MTTKKILCVDASSLKSSTCGRKMFLTVAQGYRSRKDSNDLLYGTCFHLAAEKVAHGVQPHEALQAALDKWDADIPNCEVKYTAKYLTREHLYQCLMKFFIELRVNDIFTRCPCIKIGDTALAECKFSIPIYSDDTVDVLVQGTMDGIFQIDGGCPCIGDWKTTRAKDAEDYFYGYKMSTQLRMYTWAIRWYLENYPASPLTKAFAGAPKLGAFIYGAFLDSKNIVDFRRSQVFSFSDKDMSRFDTMLKLAVVKLVEDWKKYESTGLIPPPEGIINNACQEIYGSQCTFYHACSSCVGLSSADDEQTLFDAIIKNNFKQIDYRPLEFGGGEKKKLSV